MTKQAKIEFDLLNQKSELTFREKILKEAFSHVGYTEGPDNDNIFGHYFNFNGVAWCGLFCSYCAWIGSAIVLVNTNKGRRGMAYVPAALVYYEKKGCLTTDPKPGDLVIMDFNGNLVDHVGIYHKTENGLHFCIEGNTAFDEIGSQSHGGAVAYKKRNPKKIKMFFVDLEKAKNLNLIP